MSAAVDGETGLFLDGLRCAGCVNRVERVLRGAPGVREASVNYTSHRALVSFDPARTSVDTLVAAIDDLGFSATPYDPDALDRPPQRDARRWLVRALVAAFLAGNIMLVAGALYIGAFEGLDLETRRALRWLGIALSLPAVSWCAAPFWLGAWQGLRQRSITIDVPIVLGIGTAFATNIAGTLAESDHLYVDSAAMIVFLILLGRTLERGARARASAAVDRLTALTPPTALCRRAAGTLERVPAAELVAGDRVVVAPGEVVPADALVVGAASEFDESLLTGESAPVLRAAGDPVTGGTLNALCEVELEVRHAVGEGALARLAALLERAQAERPQVQRLADRVAAVFAPVVVAAGVATALAWWWSGASWLDTALASSAVLIVACPCALGLATPAAVTSAIGRAAALGILVKSGEALERCARVDHCVLDKTGTVTEGKLEVAAVECAPGVEAAELLALAAFAEGASTHPIAAAFRRAAKVGAASPEAQRSIVPGRGVECVHEGVTLRAGSYDLLRDAGIAAPPSLLARAAKLGDEGNSVVWVARDSSVLGVLGLIDQPRPDAARAVARLRALGVRPELVTGDQPAAARHVARAAGIDACDELRARVSPGGKVEVVTRHRRSGARVLAVGDGVNDAAALAAADVGCAMASGADVALHAADLVIRSPRLEAVPDAIEVFARATLARIRENLAFAVIYNAVAIPLAALGWLSPLLAAGAMSISSVIVTANAIRLQRWRAET